MKTHFFLDICMILVGAISVLTFAPFYYFFILYFTLAILLLNWLTCSARRAAWRGFLFGIGYFGGGISWVYISIHDFGGVNPLFSVCITLGLMVVLSSLIALPGYFFKKCWKSGSLIHALLLFPSLWVLSEWVRSWLFTGFPWLYAGESQVPGPLAGFLPVVGVFGTSWLTAFTAALILILISIKHASHRSRYVAGFLLIILLVSGQSLRHVHWTKPLGQPIQASLIQGNIPQSLKWDPAMVDLSLKRYQELTNLSLSSALIIWPESAIPLTLEDATPYLAQLNQRAQKHQASILLGIPVSANDNAGTYYNSMLVLGKDRGLYHKIHLVPFGEYVPLEAYFNHMMQLLAIPMTGFIPGDKNQALLNVQGIEIAPFICYEIAYPTLIRRTLPQANLLVTINDDAWFGHSIAGWQHLQIAQAQAIITGRDILFDSNDGVTAFINNRGQLTEIAPRFVVARLQGLTQAYQGSTPWTWLGDWPIIGLSFLILLLCRLRRKFN